jgi:hypothetical protein
VVIDRYDDRYNRMPPDEWWLVTIALVRPGSSASIAIAI